MADDPNIRDPQSLFGKQLSLLTGVTPSFRMKGSKLETVLPTNVEYDAPYRGKKNERNAFFINTVEGGTPIEFWINPSECSWRIPLRTTIEAIQGGAVHHEWDAIGVGIQNQQKFDQPVINFTFQAGNVAPWSWLDVEQETFSRTKIPKGLGNFYDFLGLLNEPNITTTGEPNYITIQYKSIMMPNIILQGFFTQEGVQWTDSADNPNGISNWGASFVVFNSVPSMFDSGMLRDVYNQIFSPTFE
jgi:hypothetical protein